LACHGIRLQQYIDDPNRLLLIEEPLTQEGTVSPIAEIETTQRI